MSKGNFWLYTIATTALVWSMREQYFQLIYLVIVIKGWNCNHKMYTHICNSYLSDLKQRYKIHVLFGAAGRERRRYDQDSALLWLCEITMVTMTCVRITVVLNVWQYPLFNRVVMMVDVSSCFQVIWVVSRVTFPNIWMNYWFWCVWKRFFL